MPYAHCGSAGKQVMSHLGALPGPNGPDVLFRFGNSLGFRIIAEVMAILTHSQRTMIMSTH